MSKGQGKYIIGVFVMIAAISLGMMGEFAIRFVLQNALTNMNENFARYESMTHSYMIANNGVNNVGNHTEMSTNLQTTPRCRFDDTLNPSVGAPNEGERYRVKFRKLPSESFGPGDCSFDGDTVFTDPDFKSSNLATVPYIRPFPEIAFWSYAEDQSQGHSFYIHTRVKPDR